MVAALDPEQRRVDSLVLDSGPTLSAKDITRGFFDTIGAKLLPAVLRLPIIYPVFRAMFTTAALAMLATDWPPSRLGGAPVPTLFIVGTADTVARAADVEPVARLISDGQLAVVPEAKHLRALRTSGEFYVCTVLAFLDKMLGAPALTEAG
jgi:pimeloyl-ACP methyl ester carboxylesterase